MSQKDTRAIVAAAAFVESMTTRHDGWINGGDFWHGWALREAFLAGMKFGKAESRRERRLARHKRK
jgi:hypothetical protein